MTPTERLDYISGCNKSFNGIICTQPTLKKICKEVGYDAYSKYLYLLSIDVDDFIEINGLQDLYNKLSDDDKESLYLFDLLKAEPHWRIMLIEALNFFICGDVIYDDNKKQINIIYNDKSFLLTKDIYEDLRYFIMTCACLKVEDKRPKKFYNETARKAYEMLMAKRKKQRKKKTKNGEDPNYQLWNMIGALSSKHPSYNLINIWDLTIYQLYDQFSRIQGQVQFDIYSCRWAVWGKDTFDYSLWFKQNQNDQSI